MFNLFFSILVYEVNKILIGRKPRCGNSLDIQIAILGNLFRRTEIETCVDLVFKDFINSYDDKRRKPVRQNCSK